MGNKELEEFGFQFDKHPLLTKQETALLADLMGKQAFNTDKKVNKKETTAVKLPQPLQISLS